MPDPTWQASLDFLRSLSDVPAAQANAITLTQARARWQHAIIARISMHDLLFTLPDAGYPSTSSVSVQWASGVSVIARRQDSRLAEESRCEPEQVDTCLDTALEQLTSPARTCRRCGRPVRVSAEQFDVFERMHYSCFHYLFEHDPYDPDEECSAAGCPSASIGPVRRPEQPRDALVEELIDKLMFTQLGAQSADVRIERRGPGMLQARFDTNSYLITVRTDPRSGRA